MRSTHHRVNINIRDRGLPLIVNKEILYFINVTIDSVRFDYQSGNDDVDKVLDNDDTAGDYETLFEAHDGILSEYLRYLAEVEEITVTREEIERYNVKVTAAVNDMVTVILSTRGWMIGDFFLENQEHTGDYDTALHRILTLTMAVPKRDSMNISFNDSMKMAANFRRLVRILNG